MRKYFFSTMSTLVVFFFRPRQSKHFFLFIFLEMAHAALNQGNISPQFYKINTNVQKEWLNRIFIGLKDSHRQHFAWRRCGERLYFGRCVCNLRF
jgi:hypothetical protein